MLNPWKMSCNGQAYEHQRTCLKDVLPSRETSFARCTKPISLSRWERGRERADTGKRMTDTSCMSARKIPLSRPLTLARARMLRSDQTRAERILWKRLRAKRFLGKKFRRQVPVGPYIADFLFAETKLILEVDGSSHFLPGRREHDQIRDAYMQKRGFRVIRFSNCAVIRSMDLVLERIDEFIGSPCHVR